MEEYLAFLRENILEYEIVAWTNSKLVKEAIEKEQREIHKSVGFKMLLRKIDHFNKVK
jgi:hypothetical protein